MGKRHVSLKDLAKELNVSISTVSRALKDHPDISNALRTKIKKLAAERNYSPNPLAMGLLKQATRMIGIIVPDLVSHFYSSIISGIESVAADKGYFVVIANSNERYEKEKESIENLLKARVEGLIVCMSCETSDTAHFRQLVQKGIPLVMFDRVCLPNLIPAVVADNAEASQKIIQHFYDRGYRRIAYVSGPEQMNISQERLLGYRAGLKACSLEPDPALVEFCDLSFESAKAAMKRLLQLANPPDAVYGINDTVAFGLMNAIKEAGLRIPEDTGVVGFTDEFHSTVVSPPLTSITHPTFEMGQKTAELFFKHLNSDVPPETIVLKTQLIERLSSSK
ncbi:LacI family DNA-binding transcriptional regulator [Mangrovibacterium marinum]|uniref:LacI family transcriptional regulator n=1 Tax=Mangrovibacterium marinum TaxID=1639118 RepID=A0A2T5BZT0_9BACT|nr:LacI family DNA-binding transcriptional regulator [Mangrovibacterium marinum]PTN07790.1 LacI family transcriptional regulator [Mangrovibacterium marinum]